MRRAVIGNADCIGRRSADYCRGVGLQRPAWTNAKLHTWIKELQKVNPKLQLCEFKPSPSVSTDGFLILISLSQTVEASLFCWYSERGCSLCLTLDLNYEHHFCCQHEQNEWLQQVSDSNCLKNIRWAERFSSHLQTRLLGLNNHYTSA